jgi:hypothetical protein
MYKHYTCSTKLSYHHINLISSQYSFNGFRSLWKLFHKTFTSRLKTTTWLKVWNQYQCFNNYRHILLTRTVRLGYTTILEGIGLHVTLQHFHSITTPKNRCAMQKNRCHRLRERFSGRCAPRRCLSLSQRFFSNDNAL